MIKITHSDLNSLALKYKDLLKKWLYFDEKNKTNNNKKDRISKIVETDGDIQYRNMLQYYHNNFDVLIELDSEKAFRNEISNFRCKFGREILKFTQAEKEAQKNTSFGMFKERMQYFYREFFDAKYTGDEEEYRGYTNGAWLTKKIGMTTCPYCNRQYTFTICLEKDKLKTRPQLDHFFPKSIYPYFALSFYNLVPSCPTCNQIKSEQEIEIHPYMDEFGSKYRFIAATVAGDEVNDWVLGKENITIKFSSRNKNIERLGLAELYSEHIDYVKEIIDKCLAYNESYYDSLINSFRGLGTREEEIDRIIWGNYIETTEQKKRPLSKLTRDILEQLGIK